MKTCLYKGVSYSKNVLGQKGVLSPKLNYVEWPIEKDLKLIENSSG